MKKLAFSGGDQIKKSAYYATVRRTKIGAWISAFNNVSDVEVGERGEVTFKASKFAAQGIARESGFDVYSHGGDAYSLNHRSKRTGKRVVESVFSDEQREFLTASSL